MASYHQTRHERHHSQCWFCDFCRHLTIVRRVTAVGRSGKPRPPADAGTGQGLDWTQTRQDRHPGEADSAAGLSL